MKWFIWDGKERMEMDSEGQISRFDSRTGDAPSILSGGRSARPATRIAAIHSHG